LNIRWKTHEYVGLFLQRYITEVSWKRNPANKKYNIVKYKVYRRDKDKYYKPYELIHEATSDVFQYLDLDVKAKGKYVYSVTAVDAFGHESRVEGLPYENFSAIVERVDSADRTSDRRIIK